MKRSNRLIMLIGFLLAAVAFVGVVLLLGNGGSGTNQPGIDATKTTYIVAAKDIPLGTIVTADMIESKDIKVTEKPADAYTLPADAIGLTATTDVLAGQKVGPQTFSTVTVNPDIGRLLDPGKRAIAVPVDQVSGVGTLIKPGDRVDVVLAFTEDQTAKNPITIENAPTREGQPLTTVRNFTTVDALLSNTTVKVLVENLRVVGSLLPPPTGETTADPNAPTGPTYGGGAGTQLVLLEVTPQQAELIRFTQLDGNLSLVLRAPGDAEAAPVKTTGITVRELVDKYGVLPPKIILTEQP